MLHQLLGAMLVRLKISDSPSGLAVRVCFRIVVFRSLPGTKCTYCSTLSAGFARRRDFDLDRVGQVFAASSAISLGMVAEKSSV